MFRSKMKGILIILLFNVLVLHGCDTCGSSLFQFCVTINNITVMVGQKVPCGCTNLIFDDSEQNFICSSDVITTTDAVTTTTGAITTTTEAVTTTSEAVTTTTEAVTTSAETSTVVTTTSSTYTEPVCKEVGAGSYAAELCYQYYVCAKNLIFWWKLTLKSCSSGYAFDSTTQTCVADASCVQ